MSKSFEREFEEQSLQTLYRKMKKTAKARFGCAQRLRKHHMFTLWSLSLFSAGLIVLTILTSFDIAVHVDPKIHTFLQVILGLFVLVISLLLNSNNAIDRAEKMHRCALQINGLCHEILPACKENTDQELYRNTQFRYSSILDSYENHDSIDFAFVRLELKEDYNVKQMERAWIYLRYWSGYWIHVALLAVLLGVFVFIGVLERRANQAVQRTSATPTSLT